MSENTNRKKVESQAQTRILRVFAKRLKQGAIEKTEENPALVLSHNSYMQARPKALAQMVVAQSALKAFGSKQASCPFVSSLLHLAL